MKRAFLPLAVWCLMQAACISPSVNVFEKDIAIPHSAWTTDFRPAISVDIKDTASRYNMFVVVRHTDAYRYNNLWMNISVRFPADTAVKKQRFNLLLATDQKGWLGSGMDDIYEQRVPLPWKQFPRPGAYTFTLENIMRDDPLEHVLDVGIRVEKEE